MCVVKKKICKFERHLGRCPDAEGGLGQEANTGQDDGNADHHCDTVVRHVNIPIKCRMRDHQAEDRTNNLTSRMLDLMLT